MNRGGPAFASSAARCLSAHEMAALLLLRQGPIDAACAPHDAATLQHSGLACRYEAESGGMRFAITDQGKAILHALGAA